jgi:hypothetical protein
MTVKIVVPTWGNLLGNVGVSELAKVEVIGESAKDAEKR